MNLWYAEMDKYVGGLRFQILSRAETCTPLHTKVFDYEILIKIQSTRAIFTLYCLCHISITLTKSLYLNCT